MERLWTLAAARAPPSSGQPLAQPQGRRRGGGGTSAFTGRGVLFSATRQLAIGFAAAAVTFAAGRLIGVSAP
jgi:hypothetical protein